MCQDQDRAAHLQVWWGLCVQSSRIKSWGSVSHNYDFSKENQLDFHLLWKEAKPQITHGRQIPAFLHGGCSGEWRRAVLVAHQEGLFVILYPHKGVALSVASDQIKSHDLQEMRSSCLKVYLQSSWLPLVNVKADHADLYNWQKPTNCSFSAWFQGNIEAYFAYLSPPSEETAALAQHLQYFCLTLQDLEDKAVPWWLSERDIGFWSGTESLSSFLSLDTPFQLVNLDIWLNFICLIEFMSYLTADFPSSWWVGWSLMQDPQSSSCWGQPCWILMCCGIHFLQKIFMDCHDTDWFILLGFSRGIGGFKPAGSKGGAGLESPSPW